MAEFIHPLELHTIRAGTDVLLQQLGGSKPETSFAWTCSEDCCIDILSVSIWTVLSRRYKLPDQCFKLIWNLPHKAALTCTVIVTYVLQPLSDGTWFESDSDANLVQCFVCEQPCRDADDDDSRDDNCQRCFPCFLCSDCKLVLPCGAACCYDCLTVEEIHCVANPFRLQMLRPELFNESTPAADMRCNG